MTLTMLKLERDNLKNKKKIKNIANKSKSIIIRPNHIKTNTNAEKTKQKQKKQSNHTHL